MTLSRNKPLAIGDRVAYSSTFLRSIAGHTLPKANMRATVTGFLPFANRRLVRLAWDDGDENSVLEPNLRHIQDLHKEAV